MRKPEGLELLCTVLAKLDLWYVCKNSEEYDLARRFWIEWRNKWDPYK